MPQRSELSRLGSMEPSAAEAVVTHFVTHLVTCAVRRKYRPEPSATAAWRSSD
jgi:hypothetical protein